MKRKFLLFLLAKTIFIVHILYSQTDSSAFKFKPLYPLNIPMVISGCFGDLRANALHFGIDFKTQSKTGFPVFATDSGYISRIKIEPGGYGKAVYITHKNGWVSVYAHLEKLQANLEKYCKQQQYKLLQFNVDLFPGKDSLKVNRGDTIGLSGNSGSSTGPHLHFEIRDEINQIPVNIISYFHFPVFDTVPPVIEKLWIYQSHNNNQFQKNEFKVISNSDSIYLENNPIIYGWSKIGVGIEVSDPSDSKFQKTGVYRIELWDNDSLIFNQTFDKFSFNEPRFVNSLIDYEYFISSFKRINKLFVQPNNQLSIYNKKLHNGYIILKDTTLHTIKIKVQDANLNTSILKFNIKGDSSLYCTNSLSMEYAKKIYCKKEQEFSEKNIKIYFQPNSLYEDLDFQYYTLPRTEGLYSNIHQIHNKYTPIHQPVLLRITPKHLPDSLEDKAIIAIIEKNKPVWGSGSFKKGYVETYIRQFGDYAITIDTTPPKIRPLFKTENIPDFSNEQKIAFKITDDLSGINTFQGSIDGNWALFEFDAKNDLLYYIFDSERITFGKMHQLLLVVTDAKGNFSEFRIEFFK